MIGVIPWTQGSFFYFLGPCLLTTSRNTGWMDIHEIYRIWTQEAIYATLFHAWEDCFTLFKLDVVEVCALGVLLVLRCNLGCCTIKDVHRQLILNQNVVKTRSSMICIWVTHWLCNFAQYGNDTAVVSANFQYNLTTETDVMNEHNFAGFEFKMNFGILHCKLPMGTKTNYCPWLQTRYETLPNIPSATKMAEYNHGSLYIVISIISLRRSRYWCVWFKYFQYSPGSLI